MKNPLLLTYAEEQDHQLVAQSLAGDREALDALVRRHQPFIYNVAWKMVHDPDDAWDLTQEVMIKVITKLAQFQQRSSFRTWLYRIVVNEFLQGKRRKSEEQFSSFEEYGARLDSIPNPELNVEERIELQELSKEMQLKCMSGMLMCLTREQRLIFVLGDSFGIDHKIGAELFEITPANFRVKLHRARKELYNYMNNKCGLVNKDNPCRCPKKAKALKKMGVLDEEKMEFNRDFRHRVADYAEQNYADAARSYEEQYSRLYQEHPVKTEFSKKTVVTEIINRPGVLKYLEDGRI